MSSMRHGDLVEVRSASEIAKTLDDTGSIDSLPFMAEMQEFCGKQFRVSRRALTACFSDPPGTYRGFNSDRIVTLDGLRCSGAAHDGCQKACVIFWREEWLRTVGDEPQIVSDVEIAPITRSGDNYRCQATELLKATHAMSRVDRVSRYLDGLRQGNFTVFRMMRCVSIAVIWWIRTKLFGLYARGSQTKTPIESLNLQPGEWVEVKPMKNIIETLDKNGQNRRLYFSPDMRLFCGRKLRVKSRLDKMIIDGTGQMRRLKNTVCLEGSTCGCAYMGLGMADCSRCEFTLWREIWLQRCDSSEARDQ